MEAESLYLRVLAIREEQPGHYHPDTAQILNNMAWFYARQGKSVEAEPLYQRALAIREEHLGQYHPDTLAVRENYTQLRHELERDSEAGQVETQG